VQRIDWEYPFLGAIKRTGPFLSALLIGEKIPVGRSSPEVAWKLFTGSDAFTGWYFIQPVSISLATSALGE
jgi:hypothetical protein